MKLTIPANLAFYVDRDGVAASPSDRTQGFDVNYPDKLTIHFESEEDAVELAVKILERMGERT